MKKNDVKSPITKNLRTSDGPVRNYYREKSKKKCFTDYNRVSSSSTISIVHRNTCLKCKKKKEIRSVAPVQHHPRKTARLRTQHVTFSTLCGQHLVPNPIMFTPKHRSCTVDQAISSVDQAVFVGFKCATVQPQLQLGNDGCGHEAPCSFTEDTTGNTP